MFVDVLKATLNLRQTQSEPFNLAVDKSVATRPRDCEEIKLQHFLHVLFQRLAGHKKMRLRGFFHSPPHSRLSNAT